MLTFLKTLCKSSFKKETLSQVFSYEFCGISKNTFFTEHIWSTASSFAYLQNLTEWMFSKLVTSYLWNKYENVLKKFRKCIEKFKCFCNLCVTKVVNNLEITSVCSSQICTSDYMFNREILDKLTEFAFLKL